MLTVVYDYIHDAVNRRVAELKNADSSIDEDIVYWTIIDAIECGSISLDDLPNLTLEVS